MDWNAAEVKQKINYACRKFELYTSSSVSASLSESPPSAKWLLPSFILVTLAAWVLLAITLWLKKNRRSLSLLDTVAPTLSATMRYQGYQSVSAGEDSAAPAAVRGGSEDAGISMEVFNSLGDTDDSSIPVSHIDKHTELKYFHVRNV